MRIKFPQNWANVGKKLDVLFTAMKAVHFLSIHMMKSEGLRCWFDKANKSNKRYCREASQCAFSAQWMESGLVWLSGHNRQHSRCHLLEKRAAAWMEPFQTNGNWYAHSSLRTVVGIMHDSYHHKYNENHEAQYRHILIWIENHNSSQYQLSNISYIPIYYR